MTDICFYFDGNYFRNISNWIVTNNYSPNYVFYFNFGQNILKNFIFQFNTNVLFYITINSIYNLTLYDCFIYHSSSITSYLVYNNFKTFFSTITNTPTNYLTHNLYSSYYCNQNIINEQLTPCQTLNNCSNHYEESKKIYFYPIITLINLLLISQK